jgi:hypothetical protein
MIEPKIGKEVQQQLDEIHANVVKSKKQIKTLWSVLAGLAIVLFALGYFIGNPLYFFGIFAGLIAGGGIHSYLSSKSRAGFKANIITKVINEDEDLGIQYFYDQSISVVEFEASKIFQRHVDRYSGEDLFVGTWGKTKFKFSEVDAEEKHERTNAQGHSSTHYETIFKGVIFIAEFHKNLKGITRVKEGKDGFFEKLFAGKSKVNLENPVFEKIYNTYSDNQVEARYILTPDMMERMLKLREKFNSKVEFSFLNNLVFIAIHSNKDKFELDRKKQVDKAQIKRVFAEIDSFVQIIDMLNLNLRIWGEVE